MMADKPEPVMVEDPPNPSLPELQQREIPFEMMTVPVKVEGPTPVRVLPARSGPAFTVPLATTGIPANALHHDLKRSAATLIADTDWFYYRQSGGEAVPWPTGVPLVLTHCDAVYAKAQSEAGTLSVITEVYGD